jgi:DNA-binding MarR family transcriptional regulator
VKLTEKLHWLSSQWARRDLSMRAKHVLFALVERSDNDGRCYPSVETIAGDCGVSRPTAVRALRELVDGRLIARIQRRDAAGDLGTTLYVLSPEGQFTAEPTPVHGCTDGMATDEPTGRFTGEPEIPPPRNPPSEQSSADADDAEYGHEQSSAETSRETLAPPALAGIWNSICAPAGLPAVKALSSGRRRHANARIREHPHPGYWREVFERITHSKFLTGQADARNGSHPWRATFDWIVKTDCNATKVLEGTYDDCEAQRPYSPL